MSSSPGWGTKTPHAAQPKEIKWTVKKKNEGEVWETIAGKGWIWEGLWTKAWFSPQVCMHHLGQCVESRATAGIGISFRWVIRRYHFYTGRFKEVPPLGRVDHLPQGIPSFGWSPLDPARWLIRGIRGRAWFLTSFITSVRCFVKCTHSPTVLEGPEGACYSSLLQNSATRTAQRSILKSKWSLGKFVYKL